MDSGPLTLVREGGCVRDFLWACKTPAGVVVGDALVEALVARGCRTVDRPAFLREVHTDTEDTIVVVPRTGRIQIRVNYTVAHEHRATRAQHVAKLIASALGLATP